MKNINELNIEAKEYYKKSIKRLKDLGIAAKEVIES